jgi:segregation and condensation protein A
MDYQVDLDVFRGPVDLLLYLVRREEVDIRDISMARVASQFVDYVHVLAQVDVDTVGDFLVLAATLMEIKSRSLLPRSEEMSEEAADSGQELVKHLIEYKKFKDAALLLEAQAESRQNRLPRLTVETPAVPDPGSQPLKHVELWDLVSAFGRLMRETLALEPQQIAVDTTPVNVYMEEIVERLRAGGGRMKFELLFTPPHRRTRLIGLFLAILELIREKSIVAEQAEAFAEIRLVLARNQIEAEPMPDGPGE